MYIEIDGWKIGLTFSSAHLIPGHSKCSRMHGHQYGIKVKIHGNEVKGMIVDFHYLKDILRNFREMIDHRLILPIPGKSDFIHVEVKEETAYVSFDNKKYSLPVGDCIFLPIQVPTAENLSAYLAEVLAKEMKKFENINKVEACIDEGAGQGVWHSLELK